MAALQWSEAFEQLLRFHCQQLDPADPIDPDTAFVLLGIDSFELLHLILDCEESFAVDFSEDKLTGDLFDTPGTFWCALRELLAERSPEVGE